MDRPDPPVQWPSAGRRFLVIAGLTGFAISQPLLSVFGDDPTTLAFHGVEGSSLVLFAVLVAVVPPVSLWALVTGVGWVDRRAGRALHLLAVAGLAACFVVQVLKSAGLEQSTALAATAIAAGVAFAIAHVRLVAMATWASYTAVLPLLAVALFTFGSPASALLSPPDPPEVAAVEGGDQPSVVLIVLDELPTQSLLDEAGRIDSARFPNLAAFAGDATWYRHNSALAPVTNSALPAMLTGRLPTLDAPLFAHHPDNLFTLLAPTHELEVLESLTTLCPYDSCPPTVAGDDGEQEEIDDGSPGLSDLIDTSVDVWFDRVSIEPPPPPELDDFEEADEEVDPPAPDLTVDESASGEVSSGGGGDDEGLIARSTRAQVLLESFDVDKGPSLYYLHLMLPHQPWERWPDGGRYDGFDSYVLTLAEGDRGLPFSWGEWIAAVSEQRHLLQAQYTDRLIGELMDGLRDEGLYDGSLVIVTADHGASFEVGTSTRNVAESTIDAIAYSPLLIKRPGQAEGAVDDSNLMSFDLLPTIADHLDLPVPWAVDGAPAGSTAIAARGDAKLIYDISGFAEFTLDGIIEWHDGDQVPDADNRWVGRLREADDPLSGLNALLEVGTMIGTRLDDFDPVAGEQAQIESLDDLLHPAEGHPPRALVTGRVPGAPVDSEVVLAINGVVVGGSKLSTDSDGRDGHIAVLLPQGVLQRENDVRAALVVGGEVRELEVVDL